MAERIQQLIRLLNRQTIEQDLVRLVRDRTGRREVAPREVSHLVAVLTNPALLVTDLYHLLRLSHLEEGGPLPIASLRFWKNLHREEPEVVRWVLQAPDTMKALGDKCLFDQGVVGGSSEGVDLEAVGSQAYARASQVLEVLADDRRLRSFYESNRLERSSLDDEIAFYHRCAERFGIYAQLLQDFVTASTRGGPPDEEADAEPSGDEEASAVPESRASTAARPRIDLGRTREEALPLDPPAVGLAQLHEASESVEIEEDLAKLERWLLFSSLDVQSLRDRLENFIVNQQAAIERLCDDLCLFGTGTADPRRPSSYFLVGPTGVGKNYLVEQVLDGFRALWRIEVPFVLIEGPQYTYPSDINELKGAARGFIRSDEEGILTEFHKRSSRAPLAVVLVDEVEKAHPQLRRFFLSVMDRGTVTDNRGKILNFSNTMFFFTSNVGYSDVSRRTRPIGYGDRVQEETRIRQDIGQEVRRQLSPEFMNRVTMLHFNYLRREDAERIFDLEFAKIARRYLDHQGIHIDCSPRARTRIMDMGFDEEYGARNLATVLNRIVNIGVSRQLRRDAPVSGRDVSGILEALREAREGADEQAEIGRIRRRVQESARARVLYKRVTVDWCDGEFVFEPGS